MKRLLLLTTVSLIIALGFTSCTPTHEDEATRTPTPIPTPSTPAPTPAPPLATTKIDVTSSTWRSGEPYDIYSAIEKKLERVGFKVVGSEAAVYDAKLVVIYEETKGDKYIPGGYGTDIYCNLELHDMAGNVLLEKKISAATPSMVTGSLYGAALDEFEVEVYYKYLAEFIATKFGVSDEVSILVSALDDDDDDTKLGAVKSLGEIGDERSVEPLIDVLLKDLGFMVRTEAARALGKIGDQRAVEPLVIAAQEDEDSWVRIAAMEALGRIGEPRAVQPLIDILLNDSAEWARSNAAEALGEIGDQRAVEPLRYAMQHDESSDVRKHAEEALEKIR